MFYFDIDDISDGIIIIGTHTVFSITDVKTMMRQHLSSILQYYSTPNLRQCVASYAANIEFLLFVNYTSVEIRPFPWACSCSQRQSAKVQEKREK